MNKNRNIVALSNGAQVKPYSDDPVTTPNYEIPLMDAEETADFMGKWNPAMNIIDQSIGEIQHVGSNVELRVENVEDRTDKLEEDVVSIIDRLGSYASLPGDVETNTKDISDLAEKVVKNFGKLTDSTAYPPEKPVSNGELTASMYLPSGVVASHWGNYGDSFGPMSNRSNGALSKQADDLAQNSTNRWGAYSDSYTAETVNSNGALSNKVDSINEDVNNISNLIEPTVLEPIINNYNNITKKLSGLRFHRATLGGASAVIDRSEFTNSDSDLPFYVMVFGCCYSNQTNEHIPVSMMMPIRVITNNIVKTNGLTLNFNVQSGFSHIIVEFASGGALPSGSSFDFVLSGVYANPNVDNELIPFKTML